MTRTQNELQQLQQVRDKQAATLETATYREMVIQQRQLDVLDRIIAQLQDGRTVDDALNRIVENQGERQFEFHIQNEAEDRVVELLNVEQIS